MKMYVLGDRPEYVIAAVNAINAAGHSGIASEAAANDTGSIVGEISSAANSKFDMVIVICEDAKDMAISANKRGGVKAVVCKDNEDAADAVSNTAANVVLIDSGKADRRVVVGIVGTMLNAAEEPAPEKAQAPQQRREPAEQKKPIQMPQIKMPGEGFHLGNPFKSKAAPAPRRQLAPLGDSITGSIKSKGLRAALKDVFGIEDTGEQPEKEKKAKR